MRLVPIESVRTGSYLGKTIYDNSGRILLKSGVLLTEGLIKKIKQLNIFSIYIEAVSYTHLDVYKRQAETLVPLLLIQD